LIEQQPTDPFYGPYAITVSVNWNCMGRESYGHRILAGPRLAHFSYTKMERHSWCTTCIICTD